MTGRRLYEKFTDALGECSRNGYRDGRPVRVYPPSVPPAWAFLPQDERSLWNTLARKVTPRKRAS